MAEGGALLLKDQVALVTGAAAGIGRAIAELFAVQGARVFLADCDAAGLAAAAAGIRAAATGGGGAEAIACDVTDTGSVEAMARTVLERGGRVDVLVNNAGIYPRRAFLEMTEADWDRVLEVNLKGAYRCTRALAPAMAAAGRGRIVNISSVAFHVGMATLAHYGASKGGLVGLTRALARELGARGVRVNCVAPGAIRTETEQGAITPEEEQNFLAQQCLRRPLMPADVAGVCLFLASELSAGVTGQTVNVDGGWHLG